MRLFLVIVLAVLTLPGCKDSSPPGPDLTPAAAEAPWPETPTDGRLVTAEFVRMIGKGNRRGADVRVFNFSDQAVAELRMTLVYLDAEGKEVGTFPFTGVAVSLVPARGQSVLQVGGLVPESTTRVEPRVHFAGASTGPIWTEEGFTPAAIHTPPPTE